MSDQLLTAIITSVITGVFSIIVKVIEHWLEKKKKRGGHKINKQETYPKGPTNTLHAPSNKNKKLKPIMSWSFILVLVILAGFIGYFIVIIWESPIGGVPTATEQLSSVTISPTSASTKPSSMLSYVNRDFPGESIYVRSSPELHPANSNIVGWVAPGDKVIVTGWTNAPWVWYRINIPDRKLENVWISGSIQIGDKVYHALEINPSDLPQSLHINISGTPVP